MDARNSPRRSPAEDSAISRSEFDGGAGGRQALFWFMVILVVAAFFLVAVGRQRYFLRDEWQFLADRTMNVDDLFKENGGHLVAIPVAIYRMLFALFGVRTYTPYVLLSISAHIGTAVLLRVIMRRAGVRPWTASIATIPFIFLGSGAENILWAFQIGMVGSLFLGLVQLILSDHDGPIDRRDWLGLGAGMTGLFFSNVSLTMCFIVGLSALGRRGWRIAAMQTVPILSGFALWSAIESPTRFSQFPVVKLVRWTVHGSIAGLQGLGNFRGGGLAVGLVLVGGLFLAYRSIGWRSLVGSSACPIVAMLFGALFFLATTGTQRIWVGVDGASAPRYVYLVVALILPAVALSADTLLRKSGDTFFLAFGLVSIVIIGMPGNIDRFTNDFWSKLFDSEREWVSTLPRLSEASRVSPDNQPEPQQAPWVTVGWLRSALDSGRLPGQPRLTDRDLATIRLMLALDQEPAVLSFPCRPIREPISVRLTSGIPIGVSGSIAVSARFDGDESRKLLYGRTFWDGRSQALKATLRDLTVRITPVPSRSGALCQLKGQQVIDPSRP